MLREYVPGIERLDAVEAWPAYVTPRLRCLYDEVFEADVMTFTQEELAAYDLVWMCDVIEHVTHEDGESLLERIRGSVVICTPRDLFENEREVAAGIWTESHRSLWTVEEFEAMPRCQKAYVNDIGAVIAHLGPR